MKIVICGNTEKIRDKLGGEISIRHSGGGGACSSEPGCNGGGGDADPRLERVQEGCFRGRGASANSFWVKVSPSKWLKGELEGVVVSSGPTANARPVPAVSLLGLGGFYFSFLYLSSLVLVKHWSAGLFPPRLLGDRLSVTVARLAGYCCLSFLKPPKFSLFLMLLCCF